MKTVTLNLFGKNVKAKVFTSKAQAHAYAMTHTFEETNRAGDTITRTPIVYGLRDGRFAVA